MTTTVANIRGRIAEYAGNPNSVYVGRTGWYRMGYSAVQKIFVANRPGWIKDINGDRVWLIGNGWGNPFRVGVNGSQGECVELYRRKVIADSEFCERVRRELAGKVLLCWCAPQPCHADVLAQIANDGARR